MSPAAFFENPSLTPPLRTFKWKIYGKKHSRPDGAAMLLAFWRRTGKAPRGSHRLKKHLLMQVLFCGLPERIRTFDLQSRSLTRYPAVPRVGRCGNVKYSKQGYYSIFFSKLQPFFENFSSTNFGRFLACEQMGAGAVRVCGKPPSRRVNRRETNCKSLVNKKLFSLHFAQFHGVSMEKAV